MNRRTASRWMLASFGFVVLMGTACTPPAPPTGERLAIKGNKGAICLFNRECASGECRGGRCTEKVDKVGLGQECQGNEFCEGGLYCDLQAKKCAPAIKCEDLRDKLESCIKDVYAKFRPSQLGRLRRMSTKARRRFLQRIHQILYSGLCKATRGGGLPYKKAIKLKSAAAQKSCVDFAIDFKAAMGKKG